MAVSTVDDFLALLAKSKLLKPEQVARLQRGHAESDRLVQPEDVARGLVKRGLLTRWQAEKLLNGQTAFLVGKYKLIDRIGRGGMGTVFLAQHSVMGRMVALKVMARTLLKDPEAVARFKREVKSAAALSHPNIITAHDADSVDEMHFLVMEYVPGHDLNYWIKYGSPLPVAWCCECIRQVALGLQHAHERGLVHRDIKPSNLLIHQPDEDGSPLVKILDMGLARFGTELPEDGSLTRPGQIMGTPDYIAPEQASNVHQADIRADIFSLGCTLYQCLTGKLPYAGTTIMAKLLARTNGDAPLVRESRDEVPRRLEAVVAKMLARRPEDRYQTPAEVVEALAPFVLADNADDAESSVLTSPSLAATAPVGEEESDDTGLNEFLQQLQRGSANDTPGHGSPTVRGPAPGPATPLGFDAAPSSAWRRNLTELIICAVAILLILGLGAWGFRLWQRGRLADQGQRTTIGDGDKTVPPQPIDHGKKDAGPKKDGDKPSGQNSPGKGQGTEPDPTDQQPSDDKTKPETTTPEQDGPGTDAADGEQTSPEKTGPGSDEPGKVPDNTSTTPGKTLIVGLQSGELTLDAALQAALPGDTILIRHRGPLDFDPVDLTGKTPLTIAGDQGSGADGAEFWPILRQAEHVGDLKPRDVAWWQAEQLDLTFRKLHLVVGGENRPPLRAVCGMSSGHVRFDQCTLTVGVMDRASLEPEPGIALVQAISPSDKLIQVTLEHSFLRGARLESCVRAQGSGPIDVICTQSLWAGGTTPWIDARDMTGPLHVQFQRSTLYNFACLLRYVPHSELGADQAAAAKSAVNLEMRQSLFVAADATEKPLIDWKPDDDQADLAVLAEFGLFQCSGAGNIFHRVPGYFREPNKPRLADLQKWHKLDRASSAATDHELDPMLRVHPSHWELQECEPRDLEPRLQRARRLPRASANLVCGASVSDLPPALSNLTRRLPSAADLASLPRGRPRVLVVHSTRGPFKTLEAAFEEVRDDDVIEIADTGPYTPKRNFTASPGRAILASPVSHLTIRAAEKATPLIVVRDDVQTDPWPAKEERRKLILLTAEQAGALCLDGLHVVSQTTRATECTGTYTAVLQYLRCTNCSFRFPAAGKTDLKECSAHHYEGGPTATWLENNFYFDLQPSSFAVLKFQGANAHYYWTSIANCIFHADPALGVAGTGASTHSCAFRLHRNTLLGRVATTDVAFTTSWHMTDNLVIAVGAAMNIAPAGIVRDIVHAGSHNALWTGTQALSKEDREAGVNSLIPGPVLDTAPLLNGGESTPKDPYRPYRLKKGSGLLTMASDGGPVGARLEYLPDLPSDAKR